MHFLFVFFMCLIAVFSGIGADEDTGIAADEDTGIGADEVIYADARASLGLKVDFNNCQHLGRPCGMTRNSQNKPTNVVLTPCCKYLDCIGLSPNINAVPSSLPELILSKLSNRPADNTVYTGTCSLGLSYNNAYNDFDAYAKYVNGLDKID